MIQLKSSILIPVFYRIAIWILLSASVCPAASAQSISQLIKAGDKKFSDGEYYAASLYYKDALRKDAENVELNFKFAEASRLFNDYEGAANAYKTVIKYDDASHFVMSYFWLGEMLKSSCDCKYQEAIKQFQKFRNKYRKKDYYGAKTQQELSSCSWAQDHIKQKDSASIEHLGKEVNTEKSEFNPIPVFPDRLQFSSLRNISGSDKNEHYLVRIYNSQPNPEKIFIPKGASPELHIGNGAYTPDSRKFFFTQCEQLDKTNTRCDIYVTTYKDFTWTSAQKLGGQVNDPKATNTQPAPGYDESGNEVLFFASDRAGGQGQMDIWMCRIQKDGTYENAVNAGNIINTQGNEVTPFYDINNKKLFFSSDWHYGFGGYDIFESNGEYTKWTQPKNLLEPINTPQNDLYYTTSFDNSKTYLASNRKGSYFIEAETCCSDIYAYATGKKIERHDTTVVAKLDTPVNVKADSVPVATRTDTLVTAKADTVTNELATTKTEEPRKFVDEKIKKVKQLLPVTLYFHNDEPDCCNLRDTTKLDYKQTYEAYSAKLTEYKKVFSSGLQADAKTKAEQEVFNLFADKVDKGFYELVAFSSQLLDLLQSGNKIEITIKGYCSPLNYNQYNIKLGYRRIASLRNYFYHYRDGILLPYLNQGNLVLKNESMGEETAPKTVSDKLEDTRNSVYNPAAAVERRVEIVSVEIK
jgi:hypothetical protein